LCSKNTDIFITIQPPSTFFPSNAMVQLGINTSLTVAALKEKVQDITGIPVTQQKLLIESSGEPLAGDHSKLITFNVVDGSRLLLQNEVYQQEATTDLLPKAIKDAVSSIMGEPEVSSFLTMLAISPNLQATAVGKIQQMSTEQFLRWVRDVGSYFRQRYGRNLDFVVIIPQRVEAVKQMLQKFSKDLGSVAASGKTKLKREIAANSVTLFSKDIEAVQTELLEIFNKRKFVKRPAGAVLPEDLLALRLYCLPKSEVQPLFFQCVDSYMRDIFAEGTLKLQATLPENKDQKDKDKDREKDKDKEKDSWKHSISHLCKATAELRGVQGIVYRGHPGTTLELEQLKPGGVVTFTSFTTCLTHLDAARKMSEHKTLFEITLTKEFGCFVKDYSPLRVEHEVLLPPFTSFRVTSIERDSQGSSLHIRMECCQIPPAVAPLLPPTPPLTPDEEKTRLRTEFFVAIVEGNAPFFLYNKRIPAEFAKEKNDRGQTALHVAARHSGSEFVMTWLLTQGADVNATDLTGASPLHVAVAAKQKSLAKILIQRGALLEAKNLAGKAPKDENPEFLAQLLSKIKKVEEPPVVPPDSPQKKGKSRSQEFESIAAPPPRMISSHSESPLFVSNTPQFEAIEMRSICLKQVAALEKEEKVTKAQAKSLRLKIMKEDVSVIAACQAYDNDLSMLAETLIEYLGLTD